MIEKSYLTRLINDRHEKVMVYEADGPLVELQPGQSFEVESRSNVTFYARWSEVTWKENGTVHFLTRSNWTEPERGKWTIKCLNQDGRDVERRVVGGRSIILPKGVPVFVGLKLDDPLIKMKALTIVKRRVMLKDLEHEGYCRFETSLKDETVLRDASDLKALEKLLAEDKHEG